MPRHLPAGPRQCYCPGHLEPYDPVPYFTSAALPLPPLPLQAGPIYPPGYGPADPLSALPIARPRVWTVFVAFGVAFIAGVVAGSIVPIMMILVGNGGKFENGEALNEAIQAGIVRPVILLSSGAATQAMLLVTVLSAAILSPVPLRRRLRLNPSTLSPLGYLITPIGAMSVSFLFSGVVALLGIHQSGTLKLMGDAFKTLTPTELAFAIAIVGVGPGFAEEFLFRGYAQTRLVQRWGRWPAIWITATLFGVMHMDLLQSPFAFGFGIYLGYLAEKSGSIRPTMVCHAVNNSLMVVVGWLAGAGASEPTRQEGAIIAVVSLAVLLLCIVYVRVRVRPPANNDILAPLLPEPPFPAAA